MIEDDRNEIPISDSPLDYGEQHENGVDLSLIRRNLRLSPMERLRRAEKRSRELIRLRQYARREREERP